ncbi:hypothetical protein [Glycomyces paridis]|uniref:Uncharacterized protein n=1 Tax=Glycomyces paridis TaxID=2126555 RepID=A0A4S8PHQ5_9ACTN|nr:hypothetical protein [Glycomyces paridis]THV30110.1 hypothetical protein E9998_06950 [Glycomyces paridis]
MAGPTDQAAKHGFTSLDEVDPVPRAYRDRDGRHFAAPGVLARFDTAEAFAKRSSPDLQPSVGKALLDLYVCTDLPVGGTGTVLLDGTAVAAGDGRHQIEVEPGRHRIEVQGGDATTAEFEAAAGERVCFTTGHGAAVRNLHEFRTILYRVKGPEGFAAQLTGKAANASATGCLLALAGVPVIIGAAIAVSVVSSPAAQIVWSVLLLLGVAALVAGFTLGVTVTNRLQKKAAAHRLDAQHRTSGSAVAFPSAEDARVWAKGRGVRGVVLVLDLFLYRLTRSGGTAEYTGVGDHLALAHADGVRVRIDGAEAPADWAAWHYPLAPGEHAFAVEYGDGEARHEFTVKVKDVDDLTVVHVPVQVFRFWDADRAAPATLAPRIAHSVQYEAKSLVGQVTRKESENVNWVPLRYWAKG